MARMDDTTRRPSLSEADHREIPQEPDLPPRPRWVKVFLIATVALAAVFVVVHLAGGGMGNHLQP